MRNNKNSRIGIIGAGAASLTAAETLKESGYSNVSILEKNPTPGGKCDSYEYEGKVYELGAGLIAKNNKTVVDLINKYNIELRKVNSYTNNLYDVSTRKKVKDFFNLPETISFVWQLLMKYRRLCHRYESITEPGYQLTDLSLCQTFNEWAEEHKIPLVLENFERYFTGFGYGYWEEIPAAYVLKYMDWETLKSFIRGNFYTFPTGIQSLWSEVAAQHDVIYNSTVQHINRGKVITVQTNTGSFEYDYIFISSPLDEVLSLIQATKEEEYLFSQILYNDYQCYAYSLKNFPNETGFLPKYFNPNERNQPIFWYKPYTDTDFYTFYVLGDWKTSQSQIQKNIENMVHSFGGAVIKFHTCRKWKYFPRCTPESMKNGFYNRIENLQGKNNTFYIGELPSFSTVELTAHYAKELVLSKLK